MTAAPWRTLLAVVALGLLSMAAPAAAAPPPALLLDRDGPLRPGTEVVVTGFHWPASQLITVETCGNAGLGGTNHCDHTSARSVPSGPDGEIAARVTIGTPPSPCPCVLHAHIVGSGAAAKAPVELLDHPIAAPVADEDRTTARRLEVTKAELRTSHDWVAWFGGPPKRDLVLDLHNTTDQPVEHARLDVTWGRDVNPTGHVDVPSVSGVAPGETVRVVVPIELDPLAWGSYRVSGEVVGYAGTSFELQTRALPYGLLAIPGVLLALVVLVKARNGLARVVARRLALAPPPDAPPKHLAAPAADAEPAEVDAADPDDVAVGETAPLLPGSVDVEPAARAPDEQEPAWAGR